MPLASDTPVGNRIFERRTDPACCRTPKIPARSAIPTREPHSGRTRRRLATYPHEGHVAALTARLREFYSVVQLERPACRSFILRSSASPWLSTTLQVLYD